MKRILPIIVMILSAVPLMAQQQVIVSERQQEALGPINHAATREAASTAEASAPGNGEPIGTVTTDIVSSVKIGAASNSFTFLAPENVQLSTVQASDGDAIAFIYRQNISDCGGATIDNGLYRYSFSTDGGTTWSVGPAGTSSVGSTPAGCYGFGVMNPTATRLGRYPNFLLTQPDGGTTLADIKGVYVGAALDPAYPAVTDWDGMVTGMVDGATSASPSFPQEDYYFGDNDQYLPYHLTERVPGEYWYVTWDYEAGGSPEIGAVLKINKGTYNSANGQITWVDLHSLALPFQKFISTGATDSSYAHTSPTIAFAPDGMTGYVGFNGDIEDRDSVYLPVLLKTTDGGATWGDPKEVKLREFSELRDLIQSFWIVIDTTTGDTLPSGSGVPTLGFDHDLTVDKNGTPHFISVVANGGVNNANGTVTAPNYTIYSGLRKFIIDVTIDSYGDFNCLVIGDQATFRGNFGMVGAGGSDEVTADPFVQASRNMDGSKVFFSWTDSDTTGNFGSNDNSNPNFITRALDVDLMKVTNVDNWTQDDLNWVSRAVMPKTSPLVLEDGQGNYTIPTVVMDIAPNTSAAGPVSFWYFTDVGYADADFTNDIDFFYNCKENPFTNTVSDTPPGCGLSDGALTVNAAGGLGTYTYQWGAAAGSATSQTVNGLAAGIYEVTVTDSVGCSETLSVTLNDANAASLAVDSTANISCFGDGNGYASITATPVGTATISSYLWSNGETTAAATMLPAGTSTVEVTDDQNCVSTISVEIEEPSDLTLNVSVGNADCFGDATGSASATAFGGTGMLSYAWDNGGTTAAISGLPAGMYTVTVTDMNSCDKMETVMVAQPDTLALQLSSNGNTASMPPYNGFATVNYTGGTDPVEFTWTGPDAFSGSSNIIFGLNGGMYVVTATDANGCSTTDSVLVDGRVSGVGIDDELAAGISTMSIVPNPNNGHFAVSLVLDRAEDVTIEVLNLNGQVVDAVRERNTINLEQQFDLSQQASGVYMIQITTSRGSAGRKVMVR